MKKTERNPQETKRKILNAALDEFCQHGLDGARVDKIVAEAGVNKRMVYHYFSNKEGLFEAVFQEQIKILNTILVDTPTDSMKAQINHWLDHSDDIKGFFKLSSWIEFSELNGFIHKKADKTGHFEASVEFFRKMQKEGKLSKEVSPDLYLIGVMGLISFPLVLPALVKFITSKDPMSAKFREEYFEALKEMICN